MPPARPRARGRGRASARATSTWRRSTSTPTRRSPQSFGIQGIPAVKAFKDGKVVAEFTGAIPPAQVAAFFDGLVPSEADRLAGADDEDSLRRALELDPRQAEAAVKLGRILSPAATPRRPASCSRPFETDFAAAGLLARDRARRRADDDALPPAFDAWDAGDQRARARAASRRRSPPPTDPERTDLLRRVMVAIFTELGPESELAREHRRRLALAIT